MDAAAQAEARPFRERLLAMVCKYETLQARYDTLASQNGELSPSSGVHQSAPQNSYLLSEIAQLKDRVQHAEAAESEKSELRAQATRLSQEVSAVAAETRRMEEKLGRAETLAEERARLAMQVSAKAAAEVEAAKEAARVAEADTRTYLEAMGVAHAKAVEEAKRAETAEAKLLLEGQVFAEMKRAERAWLMTESVMEVAAATQKDADAKASEDRRHVIHKQQAETQPEVESEASGGDSCRAIHETQAASAPEAEPEAADDQERAPAAEVALRTRKGSRRGGRCEKFGPKDTREKVLPNLFPLSGVAAAKWIGNYQPSHSAKCRLYLFYGAGATSHSFGAWQRIMQQHYPEIELVVFEYPGHGDRADDLILDAATLEEEFFRALLITADGLETYFSCPFAFIGQSTGARVGLDIIRTLTKRFAKRPEKFYVVGRSPPLRPEALGAMPADTKPFLNWVSENILTSKTQMLKKMFSRMSYSELRQKEELWRADLQLNNTPVAPLPRTWLVVDPQGRLVKSPESDRARMVRITRTVGSVVHVTGMEEMGPRGEHWLQIDTAHEDVKPGWLLTHGRAVGIDGPLLEPAPEDEQSTPGGENVYWKAPIPFEIHYSTADLLMPRDDQLGHLPAMRDWGRFTNMEPEFVEYEDLLHDEFLMEADVLRNICEDFLRICKIR